MANGVLFNTEEPIVNTLLEVDVYKPLMLLFIMRYFDNLDVTFAFKNRTVDVRIADNVDIAQLKEELAHVRTLRFSHEEVAHFRAWSLFPEWFLKRLLELRLPEPEISVVDGQFVITVSGKWYEVTLWETIILCITNELYSRSQIGLSTAEQERAFVGGNARLSEKISFLNERPHLTFAQFGLRRRVSGLWERHVTECFATKLSTGAMIGVSNVQIARECNLEPVGTNAHELHMALYALRRHESNEAVRNVSFEVLGKWQKLYGHKLLINLSDTFGSDYVLNNMTYELARDYKGFRQDSGNPIEYGEKVIAMYKRLGVDPTEKMIIFSDGLNIQRMHTIYQYFEGQIIVTFGVGTNFTNDFTTHKALSLVMKLVTAAGRPTVKLSDNIAKAIGPPEEIKYAKRLFEYDVTFSEQPTY